MYNRMSIVAMTVLKAKVNNDQEMTQSERHSHSKNRGGEKQTNVSGINTKKTYSKPSEQLFSQQAATLSHKPNLNMKTHIRRDGPYLFYKENLDTVKK